jgi:mannosyltransferase OCH1-like enzyme
MVTPKNIFQTHKSKKYIESKPKLFGAIKSWLNYAKEFNYFFYDNEMCDDFIKNNFDEKIYKAYCMLPMAVMKADLWRYCIIYKYGGIYSDTDTVCKVNPNIFINDSLLSIAPENGTGFFCQWTFSAPANSPILKTIIDLSVERILNTPIKGEHIIHYLTGPALFTDGIELYLKNNNNSVFEDKVNYVNYPSKILKVFEPKSFHENIINHLFAGDDEDGWKKERYDKLC